MQIQVIKLMANTYCQPTSSTIAVGEPTSSSPCPELPNDGRPQPSKGANADAHKWKVVPMKDYVSMFKVVDSARTNVADQFHSKAHAEQYIAHFVCDTSPPPTETDAGVGVGSVGEVTHDGTMVVDEESEKETASQGDNYHPLDSALPPDTNVQAQGSIYNTAPLQNGVSILSNMTAPVTGAVAGLEIIKVIRDQCLEFEWPVIDTSLRAKSCFVIKAYKPTNMENPTPIEVSAQFWLCTCHLGM